MLCFGYTLTDFPISIRLTSLALGQSNDCPSASKATLMNMDKYFMWIHYERLHNHNKAKHNKTVCIFFGIYCRKIQYIKHRAKYRNQKQQNKWLHLKSILSYLNYLKHFAILFWKNNDFHIKVVKTRINHAQSLKMHLSICRIEIIWFHAFFENVICCKWCDLVDVISDYQYFVHFRV